MGLDTKILGTPPESIDIAEDRRKFEALMRKHGIVQPEAATGFSFEEVNGIAGKIGYPVLVRPSYVLGGRAMQIVHGEEELEEYMASAVKVSPHHPVLVDKYLSHAIEIDVDAVADGKEVFIGGIQEHIEEGGGHSGGAAGVLPSQTPPPKGLDSIPDITPQGCKERGGGGLVNPQHAVKDGGGWGVEREPAPLRGGGVRHRAGRGQGGDRPRRAEARGVRDPDLCDAGDRVLPQGAGGRGHDRVPDQRTSVAGRARADAAWRD